MFKPDNFYDQIGNRKCSTLNSGPKMFMMAIMRLVFRRFQGTEIRNKKKVRTSVSAQTV